VSKKCEYTYIREVLEVLRVIYVVCSDCVPGLGGYQAKVPVPLLPAGFVVPVH